MSAHSDADWAQRFTTLFDSVFGAAICRSAASSAPPPRPSSPSLTIGHDRLSRALWSNIASPRWWRRATSSTASTVVYGRGCRRPLSLHRGSHRQSGQWLRQGRRLRRGSHRRCNQGPWSNGRTEGQITKLKLVKRQMYGRAGIDLLKPRLLPALRSNAPRASQSPDCSPMDRPSGCPAAVAAPPASPCPASVRGTRRNPCPPDMSLLRLLGHATNAHVRYHPVAQRRGPLLFTGTSCLTLEKVAIVSPGSPVREARRSG